MGRTILSPRQKEEMEDVCLKNEMEYWRQVRKSDGFDIDHLKARPCGLQVFKCRPDDYSVLLWLYAKMGLHQYNIQHGRNLQLQHIEKYNRDYRSFYYFITLVAEDPGIRGPVIFQTCILDRLPNKFDVQCQLARPKSEATKFKRDGDAESRLFTVPECWPSDVDLANKNRFYVVQESDLKENDWIRLYMELAFVTTNRQNRKISFFDNPKLSDLKIVEVVVETRRIVSPSNEKKLKGARNANIYIEYTQDLGECRFRKYRARIRRSVDLRTGLLSLVGDNQDLGLVVDNQDLGLVGDNQDLGLVGDNQELCLVGDNQELCLVGDNEELGCVGDIQEELSKKLLNRVYASDEARVYAVHKAETLQSSLEPGFPSFVKPMLQSHVTGGFWLGLPRQFCMIRLPHCDEMITLVDEDKEFQTKYLAKKNALSGGWRGFAIYHQLVDGDAVVFRLINPTTFKVYIIRVCDEANNDSDSNDKENDVETSKKQEKSVAEASKLRSSGKRKRGRR